MNHYREILQVNFASKIFEDSGSSLSPDRSTIIIGVIQIIGSWTSTILVERAGRRLLILISLSLMGICHLALAAFLMFKDHGFEVSNLSWVPVLTISTFTIAYCLGMGAVPFIIASETFRPEISSTANSIFSLELWFCAFLMVKFFNSVAATISLYACFIGLSCVCFITFIFTIYMVPETKGRKIDDIINELSISFRFNPRKHMIIKSDKEPSREDHNAA